MFRIVSFKLLEKDKKKLSHTCTRPDYDVSFDFGIDSLSLVTSI